MTAGQAISRKWILSGLLLVAAALICLSPFLHPDEMSSLRIWWLIMTAGAFVVLGVTAGTAWQWTGVLSALLFVGFSSQLALTQPLWFEFVRTRPTDNFAYSFFLAILLQGLGAAWYLVWRTSPVGALSLLRSVGMVRAAILIAMMLGVTVSAFSYFAEADLEGYASQLGVRAALLFVNIATILAMARSLPAQGLENAETRLSKLVSFPGSEAQPRAFDHALPYFVALWTLAACVILSFFAFERLPHVEDEVVHLFQAKYFSQGQFSVPPPVSPDSFEFYLIQIRDGKWFSVITPGWPLILSIGTLFNVPWLINPLLAAASILLAHRVVRTLSDRGFANIVILLMAVSPWYIALSASLMGHTVTLTLLLGSWTLLLVARERRKFIFALAAGLLAGLIFITRPLDGLILGGLTGLWTLGFLTDRSRWPLVVGFGLGCIVTGALLFPYNAYLTGDPLLMPLQNYLDELWHPGANRFGFGPDIGPDIRWGSLDLYRGHGLVEAVANSQHSAYSMNVELFGWGVGSLALVFVHCLWGRWTRLDRYMLVILVLSIAVAGLYWFNGSYYIGPRYWFMAFLPLVVLTAGGLRTMVSLLQATGTVARPAQRVGVVVAVLCVIAMTSFVSWRGVTKYHEHRGYHADYRDLIEQHNLRDALIFVKGEGDAELGSAFAFTTPDPRRPGPVFARDLGPERNKAVSDSLPDRQIYFVTGRVQRTDRIRIVEGPVTREMLNW